MFLILKLTTVDAMESTQRLVVFLDGKVLDVTSFASKHPGGAAVLKSSAGRDVTAAFLAAGHSANAKKLAHTFEIADKDFFFSGHFIAENSEYAESRENSKHHYSNGQVAANYHKQRRVCILEHHPEIERLYGKDWLPWIYGPFCMISFGTETSVDSFREI
jgi:hypothetical protein